MTAAYIDDFYQYELFRRLAWIRIEYQNFVLFLLKNVIS